jgi:hypothetical protein
MEITWNSYPVLISIETLKFLNKYIFISFFIAVVVLKISVNYKHFDLKINVDQIKVSCINESHYYMHLKNFKNQKIK